MNSYKGDLLFPGFAFGQLVFSLKQDGVDQENTYQGLDIETQRYEKARDQAIAKTQALQQTADKKLSPANAEIIAAHLVMLQDLDFHDLVIEGIKNELTAEKALDQASKTLSDMLTASGDEYIAERAADVVEVAGAIKSALAGETSDHATLTEATILVADNITVSQLLALDPTKVKGLALLNTGKTSHAAIVIRSLGIPAVILEKKPDDIWANKEAILDAVRGVLYTDYDSKFYASLKDDDNKFAAETLKLKSFLTKKTVSKNGKATTTLYANISTPEEAVLAVKASAEGVGLFRSEFIYMDASDYPSEETQFAAYKKAVEAMNGKPVVIRTFDIGSDKKAAYFALPAEENPALGYRSIRICQDRHELFLTQLRALYRASAYGDLAIMIPMIIAPAELDFVHEMCAQAQKELTDKNVKFNPAMKVGIMIETPAAAVLSDLLAKKVDFFSIGTNDLSQYTLAIDRTNENLAKFFNAHSQAILRLMALTVENGHKERIPVSICGELAHDEALLPFFLKIGVDHLSMASSYILKTRELIADIDTDTVNLNDYI